MPSGLRCLISSEVRNSKQPVFWTEIQVRLVSTAIQIIPDEIDAQDGLTQGWADISGIGCLFLPQKSVAGLWLCQKQPVCEQPTLHTRFYFPSVITSPPIKFWGVTEGFLLAGSSLVLTD